MSLRFVAAAGVVCFIAAAFVNVLHFWVKVRMSRNGIPVKWLMSLRDDMQMWRRYRAEARNRNWPVWPVYAYRVVLAVFVLTGIILMANANKLDRLLSGVQGVVTSLGYWLVIWVYAVTGFVALLFTVRVLRKLPQTADGKLIWRAAITDESVRNDLYLAALGWAGMVFTYFGTPALVRIVGR